MPKLKPTFIDKAEIILSRNITAAGAYSGCKTDQQFADKLGMKRDCYNRRKRNPRLWTFDELAMVADAFKVSLSWLVSDHSEEMKGE